MTADEEAALKNKSEKTIENIYSECPVKAFGYGKETMSEFMRGMWEALGGAENGAVIDWLFGGTVNAPQAASAGSAAAPPVNVISVTTPIQIRVGDEVIETTFAECMKNSGFTTRSNYVL